MDKEQIAGAVARGWCHKKNSYKVMDADLAMAIVEEIMKLNTRPVQREAIESNSVCDYCLDEQNEECKECYCDAGLFRGRKFYKAPSNRDTEPITKDMHGISGEGEFELVCPQCKSTNIINYSPHPYSCIDCGCQFILCSLNGG